MVDYLLLYADLAMEIWIQKCAYHLSMIRKKYGIYVQEKQTIKNVYHYTIIDLIIILL